MPKRKKNNTKSIHPKIYIYCEGTETERNYLAGYISHRYQGYSLVQFIEIPKIKQNTPKSIVKRIISDIKDDGHLQGDIHWAIYDRESKAKIQDKEHLEALQLAKANNINVVFSSVCIEQWFIYHFVYSKAAYTSCSNLLSESPLKQKLKDVGLHKYDKAEPEIYDYLKSGVDDARSYAKKINKEVIEDSVDGIDENQPFKLNPYTNFFEVLDSIDLFLLEESFRIDFALIKSSILFFIEEDIKDINPDDNRQYSAWLKFKENYEKYLHENSKFFEVWREKANDNLDGELIALDTNIDNFYYQNLSKCS
ncbi:RloB family protein [Photobacterium phosphoreum]|uniref:RloB family protein n=1 Tax=Photobacterium phosphoreum TaxID=659 RepID=UPI0039AEFE8C